MESQVKLFSGIVTEALAQKIADAYGQPLGKLSHVTAAAPELYEQVLVSHGARAGFALIEGVLPQQEMRVSTVQRLVIATVPAFSGRGSGMRRGMASTRSI